MPAGLDPAGSRNRGVLDEMMLSLGFAVASASLDVFGNNCSDLLAAEDHDDGKERFIETTARRATRSAGTARGARIRSTRSGQLSRIARRNRPPVQLPRRDFRLTHTLADSRLLDHYYLNAGDGPPSPGRDARVSGFGVFNRIPNLDGLAARIDPLPST